MKKWNYYNDSDPKVCAWARELIRQGFAPDGEVDCRSIAEVRADDLRGFVQCHFFCGILGWSYALRLAGWPDDKPVWTGSCPCQPFSQAGQGKVDEDERHLWPAFRALIAERRPSVCFGEQVASKDGRIWLAGVRADMEALGYVLGAADLCAAGCSAPHIRQRLYWVAKSQCAERRPVNRSCGNDRPDLLSQRKESSGRIGGSGKDVRVGYAEGDRCKGGPQLHGEHNREVIGSGRDVKRLAHFSERGLGAGPEQPIRFAPEGCGAVGMGDTNSARLQVGKAHQIEAGPTAAALTPGAWSDCQIIECEQGKYRRFKPGSFPLADGVSNRVVKLRGLGNAIVPQVAEVFIRAFIDTQIEK